MEFTITKDKNILLRISSRLCEEYEFIAERALTTPANTSELVELIEYVKKTQNTTMGELYQVHGRSFFCQADVRCVSDS
jgi:hypothetical protein